MWLSGRKLASASRVRGLALNPVSYTLFFFNLLYYFIWNANQPTCRAGLSASAELLVLTPSVVTLLSQLILSRNRFQIPFILHILYSGISNVGKAFVTNGGSGHHVEYM